MPDKKFLHIIEQCKKGNRLAQTNLYQMYYKSLFNTSLRILNNYTEAEDVMQESFIQAYNQLDYFKGNNEASFGSWLKKIIVNRSIDEVRKRKGFHVEIEKTKIHQQPEEKCKDYGLSSELVYKAILELPDKYRTILSLYLMEGYDHDEIADILNISNNNSRTSYHRAKERLKKVIKDLQPEFSLN